MIVLLLVSIHLTIASNVTVERVPRTGSPPVRRLYASSVYFDGKIFYFGGRNHSGNQINDFHSFDVNTEIWEKLEPIDDVKPLARITFAMYKSDSAIFVHGGHGPNGILNDLWSYEPNVNAWSKIEQLGDVPPPLYRMGNTDFTFNGIQYFAVSCHLTFQEDLIGSDELYLFDITTKTWRKMPKIAKSGHSIPTARREWNLNYHNGYIYLWGGSLYPDNAGSLLHRYNLSSEEWENVSVTGRLPIVRKIFNSGIYNDALYIFPGWHDEWQVDIDETFRFDLTQLENPVSAVWEELYVEKIDDYDNYLPRDSYAGIMVGNYFYMHGGYGALKPTGNFLIKLDLDTSPVGLIIINKDMDIPANRYFATLTIIAGKFYMYGGSSGTKVLEDLWVYDENKNTWTLQDTSGPGPRARLGHSAAALGNSLLIWGGKNGSDFYDDLHLYNTITNMWELVEIKSEISPLAAEGSCMEVYNDDIYLFGGKNEFRSYNQLWKFSLGSGEYTLLSDQNYQSPNSVAYSTCYAIDNKLHIAYGVLDDTDSPSQINIWDLKNHEWTYLDLSIADRRAYVASGQAGSSIVAASGSLWGNWAHDDVYIINVESATIEHTFYLGWNTFGEASLYYKNSLYAFGGGDSLPDGATRETRTVDRFYKINFPDMPCSLGTYLSDNEWISCPKGTYQDTDGSNECIQCPRGTYNDSEAAVNINQWLPCPQGTFNPYLASNFWIKWTPSFYWPAGSIEQRIAYVPHDDYSVYQPDTHESQADSAEEYSLLTVIYLTVLGSMILLVVIFHSDIRSKIPSWDMFHDMHNHEIDIIMKTRETFIGGIASLIFYAAAIFLIIQALLYYFYDNIEEVKSLIPIVIVNEFMDSIKGTIDIKMGFGEYGGQCVTEENECLPEISYTAYDIKGRLSNLQCSIRGNSCIIQLTCENCILGPSAELTFSSYENSAYSTAIKVEVTSQSSIPDYNSEIEYALFVKNGEILRGPDPTIFNFQAVPSVFQSEIRGEVAEETGYHLSLAALSKQGSSYSIENISKTRNIHAQITFEQGYSALQTLRTYKIRDDVLIMAIIGGLAGLMEIVTIIMGKIEEKYEKWLKKKQSEENVRKHIQIKRHLTNYFSNPAFNRVVGHIRRASRLASSADQLHRSVNFEDDSMVPLTLQQSYDQIASPRSPNSPGDSEQQVLSRKLSEVSDSGEQDAFTGRVEMQNQDITTPSFYRNGQWALSTNTIEKDSLKY